MAAYAALLSLMDLIEQIHHHPNPPLSLDPKQAKSLTDKISFLQCFLEDFHSRGFSQEIQALERRITDVAHAAEDVIESQILLVFEVRKRRWIPTSRISNLSTGFYEGLQRVIKDMNFIAKQSYRMMDAKKKRSTFEDDDKRSRRSLLLPPPLGPSNTTTTMVGFDHICIKIMERLTLKQSRKIDIVPIVGMGGSGKTTLARNIYEKPLIVEHFHTRLWVTISQQWDVRDVLTEILLCLRNPKSREGLSRSEEDLGDQLYKSLFGRRYLMVMDDVWSIEAWDELKFFFPDNNNGSRIMITSRLSKLALDLTGSHGIKMDLLNEDTSWDLLSKKVFADKICPPELEEIGRMIARNCQGLPLSIVTIGGHLGKSDMTRDYWEHVAENQSSLVNSDDDERCLRILSLSYIHLPVHLKPCFLYMGLFPEDHMIHAPNLIDLWVAEGFLKPIGGKTLEVVGDDYLKDLVERNLVSVYQWGVTGKIKFCVVHDVLRDLCLRQAQKENFFSVAEIDEQQVEEFSNTTRRVAIHGSILNGQNLSLYGASYSAPFLRSCIIGCQQVSELISLRSVRLLRVLAGLRRHGDYGNVDDIVPLVNSRFLCLFSRFDDISSIWSMSWNLQTLTLNRYWDKTVPLDIWKMPQLRHVRIEFIDLSDPPSSSVDGGQLIVLENLQTLLKVRNFKCSEEIVRRIPNINKLRILNDVEDDYCLNNLWRLKKLESLSIGFSRNKSCLNWWDGLTLKRLTLSNICLDSDAMSTMIGGSLPLLEVLKLIGCTFMGDEWNPVEGQFCHLKYLQLYGITDLKYWNIESTHFPCLERLQIVETSSLEEFPWSIGDIPTLVLIELVRVSDSVLISAKQMLEAQEQEYGNVTLLVQALVYHDQKELAESLASNNFKL